jgi:hypothetical protein
MSNMWQPTCEQHAWLMPRLTKFHCIPIPTPKTFKTKLLDEWLQMWPERDVLWPDQQEVDLELTEDQKKELRSAEKARREVSHHNPSPDWRADS